jgi:hypothetical protein
MEVGESLVSGSLAKCQGLGRIKNNTTDDLHQNGVDS